MARLPRDLSGAEISRALRRAGFTETHRVGSHSTWRRGAAVTTVPMHHAVKTGTLRGILRDVGMSVEEFVDLL